MLENALKCFCAIAETGSFTKAAEALYITQPSVSRHIAWLEREWSLRLFERRAGGALLTPHGRQIYDMVTQFKRVRDRTFESIRATDAPLSGTLRVGMFTGWATRRFPILNRFQAKYPGIHLEVGKYTRPETVRLLLQNRLDIVFLSHLDELISHPHVEHYPVCECPFAIRIPNAHPLAATAQTIDALGEINLFTLDQEHGGDIRNIISQTAQEKGWRFNIVTFPNVESIRTAVELLQGAAYPVSLNVSDTDLATCKLFPTDTTVPLVCYWNKKHAGQATQLFLDELQQSPLEQVVIHDLFPPAPTALHA